MTANVLEHRRARAFADAVEDRPSTAALHEGQFTEMLEAVDSLSAVPVPVLDPVVRMTQRAKLKAEFERAFAAGGGGAAVPEQRSGGSHRATEAARKFRPNTRWGRRLAVGGLAAGVAMGALGGVAVASSSALPGDSLYGMKRGIEGWQLDLAGSNAERGRLLLDQASDRMSEAQQLTSHQQEGQALSPRMADEVSRALTDMNTEGSQGRDLLKAIYQQDHSLAPLQQLAAFADSQQHQLAAIEPKLGPQMDPVTGKVQNLLSGISEDVAPLQRLAHGSTASSRTQPGAAVESGPATGGTGAVGSPQGSGSPLKGATSSGDGALVGSGGAATPQSGPSSTTSGSGALVGSLTGGLIGGTTPTTAPSDASGSGTGTSGSGSGDSATGAPSADPTGDGNGVTIPPLVPGLLPRIGIGLTG